MPAKIQRIRDPLHDIIEFDCRKGIENKLWKVIQTEEFQRLRRIKQLGFSEYIYPGATHTRFAHSIGTFKVARDLISIIKTKMTEAGGVNEDNKQRNALAAALLHDVGHGMFSHAFERVGEKLYEEKVIKSKEYFSHEEITKKIISESSITEILNKDDCGFSKDIEECISGESKDDVYKSVVSSQFDADRLDYMQRGRLMSGIRDRKIDISWILLSLDVEQRNVGGKDIVMFVVKKKGIYAIENYLLSLFHLYPTLYLHKATRAIEGMFVNLMVEMGKEVVNGNYLGLGAKHPLCKFFKKPTLDNFLDLDDSVFISSLHILKHSKNDNISAYAKGIINRNLYKCIELNPDDYDIKCLGKRIDDINAKSININNFMLDYGERSCYKSIGDEDILNHIYVIDGGGIQNISDYSAIIKSINDYRYLRVYYRRDVDGLVESLGKILESCKK